MDILDMEVRTRQSCEHALSNDSKMVNCSRREMEASTLTTRSQQTRALLAVPGGTFLLWRIGCHLYFIVQLHA
jgi:hypothetical protein